MYRNNMNSIQQGRKILKNYLIFPPLDWSKITFEMTSQNAWSITREWPIEINRKQNINLGIMFIVFSPRESCFLSLSYEYSTTQKEIVENERVNVNGIILIS